MKQKHNYINNQQFVDLILYYKKTGDRATYEKIGKCFVMIVTNLIRNPIFYGNTEDRKDDFKAEGLYYMLKGLDTYNGNVEDGKTPNAFSYFTSIAFNAFLQKRKQYKNRSEIYQSIDYIENLEEDTLSDSTVFKGSNSHSESSFESLDDQTVETLKKEIMDVDLNGSDDE
jgi:hypothetical protein